MASWSEFAAAAPSLAASIRDALHQYGPGLGYLATVRCDGAPRIHPVSPAVVSGGLYCCVLNTPKRRDLERDGRYALHAFPFEDGDDEACVRGRARLVTEPNVIRRVAEQLRAETSIDWWLYELGIESAMFTRRRAGFTVGVPATYQIWVDPLVPNVQRHQVLKPG